MEYYDQGTDLKETLGSLNDLVRAGTVRYISAGYVIDHAYRLLLMGVAISQGGKSRRWWITQISVVGGNLLLFMPSILYSNGT